MDGHPEVGADTLASALHAAPQHRAAAAARARGPARAGVLALLAAGPGVPGARGLARAQDAEELPSAARAAPPAPRVGAAAHQARLRLPPARQHAAPARARARATPTRRRCGATSSSCSPTSNSRHVARGAIRRLLWQVDVFGFHLAGIDIRQGAGVVREATGALLPGLRRRRREPRRPGAADRGAGLRPARHRARPGRRGGRAAARAGHGRAERRGLRAAGRPGVRDLDDRAAVGRARRALARAARAGDVAADGAAVRDARGARAGAGDDGRALRVRALRRAPARAGQPPDRDGRLLGLGQGHGLRRPRSGRCTTRRSSSRRRRAEVGRRARALPRPRRLAVARRRAHLPGDPGPARGHGRTAGSGSPSRARRSSARYADAELAERSLEQTVVGRAAGQRAAEPAGQATSGARRWSGSRERSRERYRALVYDDPEFLRFFSEVAPIAELSQLNIGSRPPSRRASPATSSRCARSRGCSRGRRTACCCRPGTARAPRWLGRSRAAARDVARLAVLPRADRDARDGAVQDRPRRRRALHDARRRGHRRALLGRPAAPSTRASSSAC